MERHPHVTPEVKRYRYLASGELEAWLRMNRGSCGWSPHGYANEVERLTVEYLRGVGWHPSMPPDVVGPVADRWRGVADAVHEAALTTWRRITGSTPPLVADEEPAA